MKVLKKILRFGFYIIIALFIALLLFPFLFKDKIVNAVKNALNNELVATVEFKDIDLSVWRSFPDVNIGVNELKIIGKDTFDGIPFLTTERLEIDFGLFSLFSKVDPPAIKYIGLKNPDINILVLNKDHANYMISKPSADSTKSSYRLILESYKVENGKLTYFDEEKNLKIIMEGVNHTGLGDFTQNIFDLQTHTNADVFDLTFDGSNYLQRVKADGNVNININLPENRYTLKDNLVKLNELDVKAEGFVIINETNMEMDLKFETPSGSFKNFLSVVPYAYTPDFKDTDIKGQASVKAHIKGMYSDEPKAFPGFEADIKISEGYVKYPGLTEAISEIFADLNIAAKRPDYKDMSVNIPDFRLKLGKEFVDGRLLVNNLTGDQKLDGKIHAVINLLNLKSALPMQGIEQLRGNINMNFVFKAKMSDVNNENYSAIDFTGSAKASDIIYKSVGMPLIKLQNSQATASPQSISFESSSILLGKSDLQVKANVSNPLAYFSTEKSTKTEIQVTSALFDLNEWMTTSSKSNPQQNTIGSKKLDEGLVKNATLHLDAKMKQVVFKEYNLENLNLKGNAAANILDIQQMSGVVEGNDFSVIGTVSNLYKYLTENELLTANLKFKSNKFDLNKFMVPQEKNQKSSEGVIPVPANVNMNISAEIKDLVYTNLKLNNFSGTLEVQNQELSIYNMQTDALGGKINMEGLYNTENISKPEFSIKLDLSKIKYAEAIQNLQSFKSMVPIAEYINGFFNTTLVMKGHLGSNMIPDIKTLDASGFIETLNGSITGLKALNELADKLGLNSLRQLNLENTKNWFEIVNGFLEVKSFTKKIGEIELDIAGKHAFGREMDYIVGMKIPRELMKKSNITSGLESGLAFLEKEAAKVGVNIQQGNTIHLLVHLGGSLKDPKIRITPVTSTGETLTETVQGELTDRIEQAKDAVKSEIESKEKELRDSIRTRADEEIDRVRTKAEEATAKAADSLKSKAKDIITGKIDSLSTGAIPDSIKQKAKDVLGDKAAEEVDKIKDKLKDFDPFKKKKGGT